MADHRTDEERERDARIAEEVSRRIELEERLAPVVATLAVLAWLMAFATVVALGAAVVRVVWALPG